jgi:hypothetical protein
MSHAYTEDQLVEQPAIGLFAELGWVPVSAMEETFGATGILLRETKGEVVLVSRLRAALVRLNPALPPEATRDEQIVIAVADGAGAWQVAASCTGSKWGFWPDCLNSIHWMILRNIMDRNGHIT